MTPTPEAAATIQRVYREVSALADAGGLTKAEYDRLYQEAAVAAGDFGMALEGLLMRGVELGFVTDRE